MYIGSPIAFSRDSAGRQFTPLVAISHRSGDPNAFDETLLQQLIDEAPNVLPIREFLPSASVLFALGREIPVDIGGSEGRIDNLLVTNDGYLVIVETKLFRNPEATRDVVTQTLQYGMAVGRMPILELEARIRRGQNPALGKDESIKDCIARLTIDDPLLSDLLADNFDEALEQHLRQGEFLMLVASDSIRTSVERVTRWLNEQGSSSPFKFGLVELKFYANGDQRIVIPRTVLKTQEVSRHVVVVDIQSTGVVSTSASVTDEFQNPTGSKRKESRVVKASSPPLTKNALLQLLQPEDRPIVSQLAEQLETYGFDQGGTATYLTYGFTPSDRDDFVPLIYLSKRGVWVSTVKLVRALMGDDAMLVFHREVNRFGAFFREHQVDNPNSAGSEVKYEQLRDTAPEFTAYLDGFRRKVIEADQF